MKPISRQPGLNVIKEGVSENSDSVTDPEDLKLVPPGSPSDLVRLRATASRLRLQTKRQSYINWKTNHYDNFFKQRNRKAVLCDNSLTNWAEENRTKRPVKKTSTVGQVICDGKSLSIDEALNWIRNELLLMRKMDQALARQLLSLRHEIQDIRLRWSCEDHKTLVEDIRIELEELQYLGEITDVPVHLLEFHNPLKQWGVTKLNIHNKRFSTC